MEWPAPHLVPLVERVHQRLRPGHLLRPRPQVSFYTYVDTRSTIRIKDVVRLRLSDHLRDVPPIVIEGVVSVLLCRLFGIPERRADPDALVAYHEHVRDETFEARREASRRERGRKHLDPIGNVHSLLESFLRVSIDLGLVLPAPPKLSWSQRVSRRRMGHFDSAHGCIVISRALDDVRVPTFVVDYVVYHELLHIKHPVETGQRRRIHSAAFRADERRFPQWQEAEAWLTRVAGWRGQPRTGSPDRSAGPATMHRARS